jgi:O-antigen/teichoic acid export membrane protein
MLQFTLMSDVRRVAKNFVALTVSQVLSMGLALVLVILITRYLGSDGYGKLRTALAIGAIITIFAPLGLDQLMVREVARDKTTASKYLGNVLVLESILSVPCFGLIALAAWIMRLHADSAAVLYIAAGYYILTSLAGDIRNIFQAYEKMEYIAGLTIIRSIVTLVAGAAVLLMGYGIVAVTWAYFAASALDLVLTLLVSLKRFLRPKLEIDLVFWKQKIIQALPFAVLTLVTATYAQIDVIILRALQNFNAVGWYGAATALAYTFGILPSMLSSTIFPVLSRFHVSSKDSLKYTVRKSVKYLLVLGFPIATGIAMLAGPIISLFYGADFSPAVPALRILAIYIPFSFMNAVLGIMLFSMDKQRLRLNVYLISTGARILLNIFFIYKLSLTGAAIAIVSSEALLFCLNYYFSEKHIPDLDLFPLTVKPLLASAVMAAFIFAVRSQEVVVIIIAAAIVYSALFLALRGFDQDDRAMIKDVLRGMTKKGKEGNN